MLKIKNDILIPKEPKTSIKAAPEIINVKYKPDLKIDYNAKFKPKYMKNLNIHQYIKVKVIFLIDLYFIKSAKLYDFGFLLNIL